MDKTGGGAAAGGPGYGDNELVRVVNIYESFQGDIGEQTLLGYGSLKLIKTSGPMDSTNLFALNNRVTMDTDNR